MDRPGVSVLMPTRERRDALRRALEALAKQTAPAGSYEIVIAIDGSTDGTREMVASLPLAYAVRIHEGPWRGRASACNAALELARGDVVIVLDDDMEAAPELVEHHRRHHPPGSRVCVMGAVPVRIDERSTLAARYIADKFAAHLMTISEPGHVWVPRDFYSGNTSFRAEVLRELGGFDDSFGSYGNEDVELGLRLKTAGVALRYDASALARQNYTKDLRALARDTQAKGKTTVALARAHPDAFNTLRLAAPRDGSRPWLAARAILLTLTRWRERTTEALYALGSALERAGLGRQPRFYRALLDFAFWAGVDAALGDGADEPPLALLADELHRGPIDLLLHR